VPADEALLEQAAAETTGLADPGVGDLREFVGETFDISSDDLSSFVRKADLGDNIVSTQEFNLPVGADQAAVKKSLALRNAVRESRPVEAGNYQTLSPDISTDPSDFRVSQRGEVDPSTGDLREFVDTNFDISDENLNQFVDKASGDGVQTGEFNLPTGASGPDVNRAIDLRNAVRDDETIDASRFDTIEGNRGVSFTTAARRERAAFAINPQFDAVDVGAGDLEQTDDGFTVSEPVQRQQAAAELDPQFDAVNVGREDIRQRDSGFGVTEGVRREQATAEFESQFDVFGVGELDRRDDLRKTESGGFGLARGAVAELGAQRLNEQYPAVDIGVGDVDVTEQTDGTFGVEFEGRF